MPQANVLDQIARTQQNMVGAFRSTVMSSLVGFQQLAEKAIKNLNPVLDGQVSSFIRQGAVVSEKTRTTAELLSKINKPLGLGLNESNLQIKGSRVSGEFSNEIKKFQRAFNKAMGDYCKHNGDLNILIDKDPSKKDLYQKIDQMVKADPKWKDFRLSIDGVLGNWTGSVLSALSTEEGKNLLLNQNHINTLNIVAGGYWIGETAAIMPMFKRGRDVYFENSGYDQDGNPLPQSYDSYDPLNPAQVANRVVFRHERDRGRVNQKLLSDLNYAATQLGYGRIVIGCAMTGHSKYTINGNISRHGPGNAFDISSIDGYPCNVNSARGAEMTDKLVVFLRDHLGYRFGEGRNVRGYIWRSSMGGNHYNHLHMSNTAVV